MKVHCLLIAFLLSCGLATAQEPEKEKESGQDAVPTEETIAALQEVLDGLTVASKEKSDVDLLYFVKQVEAKYKGGTSKQQGKIVGLLTKTLKTRNDELKGAALQALSTTDERGVKPLLKEMNSRSAKDNVTYLSDCIAAVGRLASEKAVKDLSKLLNHKENRVIAVAISAFGDYKKADLSIRKEIVDKLLKRYGSVASPLTKSNPSTTEKDRFDALADTFESTLRRLTAKTNITTFQLWDKWYRKEGKKAKEWNKGS